jgi:chaperonin cofactor prefoldin
MAFPVAAQTPAPSPAPSASQPQDAVPLTEPKKPKKVLTNEDLSKSTGAISVVGDAKEKPKPSAPRTANAQYIASVRKQLDKLQKQIADIDKQLVDLKNFSSGEPSTNASGVQLNKSYQREPIEVQIRALQDKKKDLQAKMDGILDEARKKGVEPGDLR